jgi:hypothetical protein
VEKELDRWVKEGILSPVQHSDVAAPLVIVRKTNKTIRLCGDFSTGLNAALLIDQYPLPKPSDLFTRLNGGQEFTKIDFSEAYLQIEVDDDAKKLLVINTTKGLFSFNRLPFGVASAPAIFQQIMETMLAGIAGVVVYLDDILITGTSRTEHLKALELVLERISEYGFRVRKEKCAFLQTSIEYLGFIVDREGIHSSPKKTEAIVNMPVPQDVPQLRSFLGMVNHYATFLPRMADRLAPLNALLQKEVAWNWSKACQSAFLETKKMLNSPLMLTHYNPDLPIVLAADASNYGIGAVIYHRFPDGSEKVIAHASKTLSSAEKNYGQIEKEALALVFGVKKFHQFLYGRQFTLLTDHKPLVSVFGSKKGIPVTTANRLQRWALVLMAYSFNIEYVSTEKFGQADGLSRLPVGSDSLFDAAETFADRQILDIQEEA